MFVSLVPNCSREELHPAIQEKILQGSTVHTDGWGAYDGLGVKGCKHHRVCSLLPKLVK
ncbi:MAG: transposase [Holosporales bacterium]|nr:transposase [Holosporales bacterium]